MALLFRRFLQPFVISSFCSTVTVLRYKRGATLLAFCKNFSESLELFVGEKSQLKNVGTMPPKRKPAAAKIANGSETTEAEGPAAIKKAKGRTNKKEKLETVAPVEANGHGNAEDHSELVEQEEPKGNKAAAGKKGKKAAKNAEPLEEEEDLPQQEDVVETKRGRGKKKVEHVAEDVVKNGEEHETESQIKPLRKKRADNVEKDRKEVDDKKVKPDRKKVEKAAPKQQVKKADKKAAPKKEKKPAKGKGGPKTAKKVESEDEDLELDDEQPSTSTARKPRAAKRPAIKDADSDDETVPPKKSRAPRAKASKEKAEKAPVNQTTTNWDSIDFGCSKTNSKGETHNLKITSWNVDGLRACLKKDALKIFEYDQPDILLLQETKCDEDKLPDEIKSIDGYKSYWCGSRKQGYAGVALFSKVEPLDVKYGIGVEDQDEDGRCITAEYEKFYLVSVYVPNAGRGLVTLPKRLEWNEAFRRFVKQLDAKKPVIVCGDMNVSHNEIDLANPKTNTKNAGFTQEERDGMTEFLSDGYVDTFRKFYPDQEKVYTFWTYMKGCRAKNIGWRLDYFIISERIVDNVCDSVIRDQVFGSDHCPITLFINI